MYTYFGDANLDGKVNALDFNAVATNFGKTPGSDVWAQGDFNYDGNVNTLDFTALAGSFGAHNRAGTGLGGPRADRAGLAGDRQRRDDLATPTSLMPALRL
jgi:hypothetical protein